MIVNDGFTHREMIFKIKKKKEIIAEYVRKLDSNFEQIRVKIDCSRIFFVEYVKSANLTGHELFSNLASTS